MMRWVGAPAAGLVGSLTAAERAALVVGDGRSMCVELHPAISVRRYVYWGARGVPTRQEPTVAAGRQQAEVLLWPASLLKLLFSEATIGGTRPDAWPR